MRSITRCRPSNDAIDVLDRVHNRIDERLCRPHGLLSNSARSHEDLGQRGGRKDNTVSGSPNLTPSLERSAMVGVARIKNGQHDAGVNDY